MEWNQVSSAQPPVVPSLKPCVTQLPLTSTIAPHYVFNHLFLLHSHCSFFSSHTCPSTRIEAPWKWKPGSFIKPLINSWFPWIQNSAYHIHIFTNRLNDDSLYIYCSINNSLYSLNAKPNVKPMSNLHENLLFLLCLMRKLNLGKLAYHVPDHTAGKW